MWPEVFENAMSWKPSLSGFVLNDSFYLIMNFFSELISILELINTFPGCRDPEIHPPLLKKAPALSGNCTPHISVSLWADGVKTKGPQTRRYVLSNFYQCFKSIRLFLPI